MNKNSIAIIALLVCGFLWYQDQLKQKPDDNQAAPAVKVITPVKPTNANLSYALSALADNLEADAKQRRPVVLYSVDLKDTTFNYFNRVFSSELKSVHADKLAELRTAIASAAGPDNEPLTTERRAACVSVLRTMAAKYR